jgi:hypothetical protein
VYLSTDPRRHLVGNLNASGYSDGKGSSSVDLSPNVTFLPRAGLSVSASMGFTTSQYDSQWITNETAGGTTHYVFGHLDQKTLSLTARVNYTIKPTLTLEIYAAPFVSAGAYSKFKELTNGRAAAYEDRYAPYAYSADPNFNYRSFRSTSVLRWEYRPGSALFVVWQHGQEDYVNDGRFQFGRNLGDLFATPSTNVFLVKFSRWLNF